MARPARFKAQEAGLAAGKRDPDAEGAGQGEGAGEALSPGTRAEPDSARKRGQVRKALVSTLDDGAGNEQTSRSDPNREAELDVSRRVASRLGWTPRDQWTRDPSKWVDADVFLERTPQEVETLKERLKRTGQVAEAQLAAERKAAQEEAESRIRTAVAAGDADTAIQAGRALASAVGPDPRTVAWVERNGWFNANAIAKSVAVAAANEAKARGGTLEDELQAAETEVRKRFPELFPGARDDQPQADPTPRRETRLSEMREPPRVAGGSRSLGHASGKPREKGWADIPAEDRSQMTIFVKNMLRKGMSQADAQASLARGYFENLGTQVRGDD